MTTASPESIRIVKEADEEGWDLYRLYIDGGSRAVLTHKDGKVNLDLEFFGNFPWSESRVFCQGLVKLMEVGDQLYGGSRKVDGLHQPTDEEIDMAKAKAKVKQKKADKKAGKPAAPRETAAALFQELIMAGNLTDDKIFEKVQTKFKLSDDKRSYVAWYRNKLKKDGKKPPEAK